MVVGAFTTIESLISRMGMEQRIFLECSLIASLILSVLLSGSLVHISFVSGPVASCFFTGTRTDNEPAWPGPVVTVFLRFVR